MLDNIRLIIAYGKLKKYLMTEGGMDERQAVYSIRRVRRMHKRTKRWFICWFRTGELPKEKIENTSIQELIEHAHLSTVNAFFTMDALLCDPDAAKAALMSPRSSFKPSAELLAPIEETDTSDIVAED